MTYNSDNSDLEISGRERYSQNNPMGRRSVQNYDRSGDSSANTYQQQSQQPTPQRRTYDLSNEAEEEAGVVQPQPRRVDLSAEMDEEAPQQRTAAQPQRRERKPSAPVEKAPNIFHDKRWRIFVGIFLFALGGLMAIMLVSHVHNGFEDQSLAANNSVNGIVASGEPVSNAGGAVGAWLTNVIFTDALGLGSVALVVYFIYLGVYLLINKRIEFWSLTFKTLLVAISVSIILGFVTYTAPSTVQWGGIHGREATKYLLDIAGTLGPITVCILLTAALVCVYLNDIVRLAKQWRKINEYRRKVIQIDVFDSSKLHKKDSEKKKAVSKERTTPVAVAPTSAPEPASEASESHESESARDVAPVPKEQVRSMEDDGFNIDEQPQGGEETSQEDPGDVPMTVNSHKEEVETEEVAELGDISTEYDHRASLSRYRFPDITLLGEHPASNDIDMEELKRNKDRIVKTLGDYKITISSITATVGPTVTLYEIIPTEGTRISQITRLEDDISMSLAASGIRIIAPMPRKGTIGIEVPNAEPKTVWMRRMLESPKFKNSKMALPVALGATIEDEVFVADLAKMPHLLVAGATGQGKSVGLNVIITSLLYKKHPTELKLVLIDPKMVEFSFYEKLDKHYLAKMPGADDAIITSPEQALETLNSLCIEMDRRLALFKQGQAKNIEEYNARFTDRKLNPEDGHYYMPYIVVIIDEFYDLMMTGGKDIEAPVIRITQKARAAGIHMIIATQRPSTNVLTGVIKANCPARIAFKVMQMVDSRTIIDRPGANKLIGRGDMLYTTGGDPERLQCAFITTQEIEDIVDAVNNQVGIEPYYLPELLGNNDGDMGQGSLGGTIGKDPLFDEAARFIVSQSSASVSSLQRRYQIGYNRAGKIMDQMEAAGIVGAPSGSKPRSVLVDSVRLEMILENT